MMQCCEITVLCSIVESVCDAKNVLESFLSYWLPERENTELYLSVKWPWIERSSQGLMCII